MSINQLKVTLERDVPANKKNQHIEIGNDSDNGNTGIQSIHVRFNKNFHIEIVQKTEKEVLITLTSGGVSKEIDSQTFKQLITMNY